LGRAPQAASLSVSFLIYNNEGITVANIKSQKKRILTNAKAAERNKAVRSEIKTRIKSAIQAAGTDEAEAAGRLLQKKLDKAGSKRVMHKNAVARQKSRLAKKLNALNAK
jgi:small subunit ribosomal protein S20